MLDYQVLAQAVGELDEDKVMELLDGFVVGKPSEEDAQKQSQPVRKVWLWWVICSSKENISLVI